MKNREEKRAYEKKVKNDRRASICPKCNYKSLFYTIGELKPEAENKENPEKEDYNTKVVCECCGATIFEGDDVSKLVPPGIYIPMRLDLFEYAFKNREELEKIPKDYVYAIKPPEEEKE